MLPVDSGRQKAGRLITGLRYAEASARAYPVSKMRRAMGQSEQPGRRARNALGALVALLAAIVAVGAAGVFDAGTTAVILSLLAVLGGGALATSGWLLARVPAQMRGLAGDRRRALDDLLRAEEVERERIATELHDDTIQAITAALVTIDRVTPAIRARDLDPQALGSFVPVTFNFNPPVGPSPLNLQRAEWFSSIRP